MLITLINSNEKFWVNPTLGMFQNVPKTCVGWDLVLPVIQHTHFHILSFLTHTLLFCSPISFTIDALLNPSFVDSDMNRIHSVASDLRNIFNAIKRAEDALDIEKTSVSF